jgi:hypothetical protein
MKMQLFKTKRTALILGALVTVALVKGSGTVQAQSVTVTVPVPAPSVTVVAQDDYVYYPHYRMYYNTYRHRFYSLNGGAWVVGAAPVGFTADVVLASPSIHMDFHDSPEHHHADIMKRYPHDWKAAAHDEHHDDHGHDADHSHDNDHGDSDHHDRH